MYIKCWGSRGSIPVSGKEYQKYGGDTTCIEVVAQSGHTVIIDAGTGIRKLGSTHDNTHNTLYYLLFTHAHWDHVIGFNFFKPLLDKNSTIVIQNSKLSNMKVKEILETLMAPPFFPIAMKDLNATINFRDDLKGRFSLGSLDIETIPLSHPNGGLGYKFTENSKSFVFLTDNELGFDHPGSLGFDSFLNFSRNADLLIHDAEFFPDEYTSRKEWGHSSCVDTLNLAMKANVKRLGLFHINQERDDRQMDQMETVCKSIVKKNNSSMDCFAVACGADFKL